jgi:hypothetical protein
MFTAEFWKAAGERALRTVAQVLLALWVSDGVFNALSVDWLNALGVALGAAVISLLMSMVPAGPAGSPSWVEDRAAGRHAR